MRRLSFLPLAVLLAGLPIGALPACAQAQYGGCPGQPPAPPIPLQLDLSSLPGAASRHATGTAMVMVPSAPANPCPTPPHLPRDVLHGDPGDALAGEGPPDLLRGPGAGRVQYGPGPTVPPVR